MQASGSSPLSDGDYGNLWNSLQHQENHICTRQCEFKQVFGNMFYCVSSGQAHVCDQNCSQRIFYDNHHDICRLSRRIFPRNEAAMIDAPARKRDGEEAVQPQCTKRPLSSDWQHQQAAAAAAATTAVLQQHPQQLLGTGPWQHTPQVLVHPPTPHSWHATC